MVGSCPRRACGTAGEGRRVVDMVVDWLIRLLPAVSSVLGIHPLSWVDNNCVPQLAAIGHALALVLASFR